MNGFHRFTHPPHLGLLVSSSLALNLLALALPLMTMQIYDRVLSNHASDTLSVLSAGVLVAALAEFALRVCRTLLTGLSGAAFEHRAASAAIEHLMQSDPRSVRAKGSAPALANDIGAAARLKDYHSGQMFATLLVDTPFILVFLGLAFYLAHFLALVPLLVLVAFTFVSWRRGRRLLALTRLHERQDDRRYDFITATLHAIHTVKSCCVEARMARRFEEAQQESGQINYEIARAHGQSASLSYAFTQGMTVLVILFGAPMVTGGRITVGTLIACVLLSGQIMQPLQRALASILRTESTLKICAIAHKKISSCCIFPLTHLTSFGILSS